MVNLGQSSEVLEYAMINIATINWGDILPGLYFFILSSNYLPSKYLKLKKIFILIINLHITVNTQIWLWWMFKKGVMKHLIIDIKSPHFRLNSLPRFIFNLLHGVVFCSNFGYTSCFNKLWKFKSMFLETPFILQEFSLLTPMLRNRNWVSNTL